MVIKYDNLKAGDKIYLYHDIDPCLFGQQTYTVYETEKGKKYIVCTDGEHFLDGMTDKDGYIQEFEKK